MGLKVKVTSSVILFLFACLFCGSVAGQPKENQARKAIRMAKKNIASHDNVGQLIVVFNESPESSTANLVALERKSNRWKLVAPPMLAGIGRKGFADPGTKREGDQKSPSGFFKLGQLFCYDSIVDTKMQFIQSSTEDKWIDDPDSDDYNRYVRGATGARSYEKLLLNGNDYRYCMVIEYNTQPVIKGNGSAIFLHLSEGKSINSSAGCVVITQNDMERLLKWMNPELNPSILMGNEKILGGR
ncbi:MAG TPA: hypothetical protein DHV48_17910 [Prolixibacteraceae bacterium]|nr:hypothetical protein [Prolixibacteraceae bacterium]